MEACFKVHCKFVIKTCLLILAAFQALVHCSINGWNHTNVAKPTKVAITDAISITVNHEVES